MSDPLVLASFLGLIFALIYILKSHNWREDRAEKILAKWANENDFIIVNKRVSWYQGSFFSNVSEVPLRCSTFT
jgi:hypothetical protein